MPAQAGASLRGPLWVSMCVSMWLSPCPWPAVVDLPFLRCQRVVPAAAAAWGAAAWRG